MNKKIFNLQVIVLSVGVFLFSCSKKGYDNINNSNFVSLEKIETISKQLHLPNGSRTNGINSKTIKEINEIPDENQNIIFYIINYNEGGFMIMSADNRIKPVLAYSDNGYFPISNNENYPPGLINWLTGIKDKIKEVRNSNKVQSQEVEASWDIKGIQKTIRGIDPYDDYVEPDDGEGNCQDVCITVGPLLQTRWGQGDGYNDLTPYLGCNNANGHAPTGCVATAMAQVMKYHQYPNTYNWSAMPNTYGTYETAVLMRDIGNAVDMDYDCDGSSADTENDVASAFINDFNYSMATYSDYHSQTVKQELNYHRPVILRGGRDNGWWIFHHYTDGHAWVCDGYKSLTLWDEDCSYFWSYLYLHMNWGWKGWYNDAWYNYNNWNPGNYTFNYHRGMVYNIKP